MALNPAFLAFMKKSALKFSATTKTISTKI